MKRWCQTSHYVCQTMYATEVVSSSRRRRRPSFAVSSSSSSSSSSVMVPTMTAAALLIGILLSSSSSAISSIVPFNDRSNKLFVAASAVALSSSVRRRPQPQQKQQFLAASASKKTAVVQPDYDLPKARGKQTPAHPWPVPSKQQAAAAAATFDYSSSQRQADAMQQSTEENASQVDVDETNGDLSFEEWLQLLQQAPSREVASQQQQYQSTMGETSSDTVSYDEWLQQQQQQRQNTQQTRQQKMGKQSAHVASMMLPPNSSSDTFSPPKDLDVMSGRKRIILRPLATATGDDSSAGSAASATLPPSDGVYYYDPAALTVSQSSLSSSSSSTSTIEYDTNDISKTNNNTPELTLPETVYDEFGTPHHINDVHNEGRNEVYLEIKPHAAAATSIVWGDGISSGRGKDFIGGVLSGSSRWNTNQNNKLSSSSMSSSLTSSSIVYSSQDQLIVFFTVATMAIMIGVLSARRLRNRNMLVDCMHPDMDDEEDDELHLDSNSFSAGVTRAFGGVRYDKKYDVDTGRSVTGASSAGGTSALFDAASDDFGTLMGVGSSRNNSSSNRRKGFSSYGTNDVDVGIGNGGGGLHWRGDMEKFDV